MSDDQDVIVCENLVKRFGDHTVLDGVSLRVAKGETVAILGRSGTGKSVLLRIIIGLLQPEGGRASILGHCLAELTERERLVLRARIGYVFQGGALFDSMTIGQNIGFPLFQIGRPAAEVRRKAWERLHMVGLEHTLDRYPSELSGGMRKRAAFARAIINLPEVVLYDEPTTGLDPLTTDVINQILLHLHSRLKVTSVVVTHDIQSAFTIADRIIMLDSSRIVFCGTPDEAQASSLPWVQHFIRGMALDSERVEATGLLSGTSRAGTLSGRRVAVQPGGGSRAAVGVASGSRAVPGAIRNLRSPAVDADAARDGTVARPGAATQR